MMLNNKNVLLGISASIAAYKSANLIRLFKKMGANVRVIQTEDSLSFITPLTISTLSENPSLYKMIDDEGSWNNHVKLALWADIFVIAPVTSKTLSKMCSGECDNLLLATYLSSKCPVYFAPAMDLDMFNHPSTKNNIEKLISYGNRYIPVEVGELASGLFGEGRMMDPENIIKYIESDLSKDLPLLNKNALVTAGPTYELFDSVRFISNFSSGRMGVCIANELAKKGAKVNLILGPTNLDINNKNYNVTRVTSTDQMYNESKKFFKNSDICVFSAAVSDFRPVKILKNKLKKNNKNINIELEPNVDIAFNLGKKKKNNQICIGFSLEDTNGLINAKEKLKKKNFDMIILNEINNNNTPFNSKSNKISIVHKNNKVIKFKMKKKVKVAEDIVQQLVDFYI